MKRTVRQNVAKRKSAAPRREIAAERATLDLSAMEHAGRVSAGIDSDRPRLCGVVCAECLRSLLARGLCIEQGLLVVDGSKGLRAAVTAVFGACGVVQRCQWHKRENVVRYLPPQHQCGIRQKLQAAYEQPTSERAKKALQRVRREVALLNMSAASSLDEGVEETLTLHRLGCFRSVGVSLKTTNILESIHARVASTDKVGHWKTSEQKQRWVATALLDLEPCLHRVKHFDALPQLQRALAREIRVAVKGHAA